MGRFVLKSRDSLTTVRGGTANQRHVLVIPHRRPGRRGPRGPTPGSTLKRYSSAPSYKSPCPRLLLRGGRRDGGMDGRVDGWMGGWRDERTEGWRDGGMDGGRRVTCSVCSPRSSLCVAAVSSCPFAVPSFGNAPSPAPAPAPSPGGSCAVGLLLPSEEEYRLLLPREVCARGCDEQAIVSDVIPRFP